MKMNSRALVACFMVWYFAVFFVAGQNRGDISDEDSIHLYYYPNTLNSSERHEFSLSDPQEHKLEKGKEAKIIVHGAGGNCLKADFPFRAVEAYLRAKVAGKGDYNVFCLDYGPLAQPGPIPGQFLPSIRQTFEYVTDVVADKATSLILALENEGYIANLEEVHVIAHSLGGHVSGFMGRKIQEKTNYRRKLGRITGLDVMNIFLVYINEVNLQNQLDLSDANFVDIIHTSPIGLRGDYGHVDFYPDGGLHQQSCLTRGPVSNVSEQIIGGCSHILVGRYWENSILGYEDLKGCKADSWEDFEKKKHSNECDSRNTITFGEHVPRSARGKYFLDYPLLKV